MHSALTDKLPSSEKESDQELTDLFKSNTNIEQKVSKQDKREEQRNKALHTKSQAGRTQKARSSATGLEGQTLWAPAELCTAWKQGGGKEKGGGDEREQGVTETM